MIRLTFRVVSNTHIARILIRLKQSLCYGHTLQSLIAVTIRTQRINQQVAVSTDLVVLSNRELNLGRFMVRSNLDVVTELIRLRDTWNDIAHCVYRMTSTSTGCSRITELHSHAERMWRLTLNAGACGQLLC